MGRFDGEFQVAAVDVVGPQRLEVGVELGARVSVGLRVPGQPAAGRQIQKRQQLRLREDRGPGNPDVLDLGGRTLGHGEGDVDAIALQGRDGGDDLRAVEAARQVLALDLLLGAVEQGPVERSAIGQACIPERRAQNVLVELLVATELDAGDRRPLLDDHHQHVAIDLDAHILEQAQAEQGLDRGRAFFVVVGIAHAHRQGCKDGPCLYPLQPFHPDVTHLERVDRPCGTGCHAQGHCHRKQVSANTFELHVVLSEAVE